MNKILYLFLVAFYFTSCKKEDNSLDSLVPVHYSLDELCFDSFSLESGGGIICKPFMMNDSTIFISVPNGLDLSKMKSSIYL